jgi:hypothetical protein
MKTTKSLTIAFAILALFAIGCEGKGGGGSTDNGQNGVILPPDPGNEGKKTLEGIDSDNDGVRDDLQIAIYNYAPKPEEERLRAAITQDAKANQLAMIAGHTKDPQIIEEARLAISLSVSCTNKIREEYEKGNFVKQMERKAFNTAERVEAYMRYNEALSGRVLGEPDEPIPCDYDREKEAKAQAAFSVKTFNIQTAYNLPPDPGSEGKKTLEGIDSNNNGIRDDVEIAIYNYAPREDQKELRQAMFQKAKSVESIVKADLSDLNALRQIVVKDFRAGACLKQSSPRTDSKDLYFIFEAVLNTPARSRADTIFFNALDSNGISYSVPKTDPNPCDYDKR